MAPHLAFAISTGYEPGYVLGIAIPVCYSSVVVGRYVRLVGSLPVKRPKSRYRRAILIRRNHVWYHDSIARSASRKHGPVGRSPVEIRLSGTGSRTKATPVGSSKSVEIRLDARFI
jgi:hypothetical protein